MKFLEQKNKLEKVIRLFLFITFLVSIISLAYLMYISPSSIDDPAYVSGEFIHVKADYFLAFAQSVLGIIVMFLPDLFERRLHLDVPSYLTVIYLIFLYGAIFLGEVRYFYYRIPYWDMILHGLSAAMLGLIGFSLVFMLNSNDKVSMNLSPGFVCLFAFAFAVMIGVFWEFYEYTFDGIWGMNMQKFMTEDGVQFVGRAALQDTMQDLMVDAAGAGIVCIFNFFVMNSDTQWLKRFKFEKIKRKCKEIIKQDSNESCDDK